MLLRITIDSHQFNVSKNAKRLKKFIKRYQKAFTLSIAILLFY
ncbi:MAG: hypothetical protein ACBR12_22330 [Microcoleus sp.]